MIGQEYQTFDNSKGQNQNGIGLGLLICKNIIQRIGNKNYLGPNKSFTIKSKINEGTSFAFIMDITENN